jgi:hypothetical protein
MNEMDISGFGTSSLDRAAPITCTAADDMGPRRVNSHFNKCPAKVKGPLGLL